MTRKEQLFCDEYLTDFNATRAYQAVYKTNKTYTSVRSRASYLLRKPEIKLYIEEQLERMHNEKIADAQEVMEYLTSVIRGNSQSEIVVVEGTGDGCSEARRFKKNPDERDRIAAANALAKVLGISNKKINAEVNVVFSGEDKLAD